MNDEREMQQPRPEWLTTMEVRQLCGFDPVPMYEVIPNKLSRNCASRLWLKSACLAHAEERDVT